MKVKMDIHFFGVHTPRGAKTSAKAKNTFICGNSSRCVRLALIEMATLTRRVTLVSDLKLQGRLFFGTHVRQQEPKRLF